MTHAIHDTKETTTSRWTCSECSMSGINQSSLFMAAKHARAYGHVTQASTNHQAVFLPNGRTDPRRLKMIKSDTALGTSVTRLNQDRAEEALLAKLPSEGMTVQDVMTFLNCNYTQANFLRIRLEKKGVIWVRRIKIRGMAGKGVNYLFPLETE